MQQAFQSLKVVAEAQTVRIVISSQPDELTLQELTRACQSLHSTESAGIKALVLDLRSGLSTTDASPTPTDLQNTITALQQVPQTVVAVIRASISSEADALLTAADLLLVDHQAHIFIRTTMSEPPEMISGQQAARIGLVTWSAPADQLGDQLERILGQLREKSALTLRQIKASIRLDQEPQQSRLSALQKVQDFYLNEVLPSADAQEGINAFLEKRQPRWQNQ